MTEPPGDSRGGSPPDGIGWVLWSGTVGLFSPVEPRIDAAVAAGFDRLSVSPADVARCEEAGVTPAELGRQIRGAGLDIVLDPIMNWYDDKSASASSPFSRYRTDHCLRVAEALGAVAATVMANVSERDVPIAGVVEPFAQLCDRAASIGVQIQLEFVPMTEIRTIAQGWQVVRDSDRGNGGLLFDAWHFFRGVPDFDVLATIPGDRVFAVQLADALPDVDGTLLEDTRRRLLPGEGSFDLRRAIRTLADTGGLTRVGPEVISPELAAMPMNDAAALAGARTRQAISSALAERNG